MKKLYFIVGLIVVAVGGFIIFQVYDNSSEQKPSETTNGISTYSNKEYAYRFSYPSALQIKEYLPENVVVGHVTGDSVDGIVEVSVVTVEGKAGRTLVEATAQQLMNSCAADGPTSSFSCTQVESEDPFTTQSGLSGTVIYLIGELTQLQSKEVTSVRKGPYYILQLATGATVSKVLVVHPPLNLSAQEADAATIRSVAEGVQVTQ